MNKIVESLINFIFGLIIGIIVMGILFNNLRSITWRDSQVGMYISPLADNWEQPEPILEPETNLNEIISKVRWLESNNGSAGLAVTCKNLGLSNDYGYNVPHCFDNHEEATATVKDWFERKLAVMSLEESLCLYNVGIQMDNCEYVDKFKMIDRL